MTHLTEDTVRIDRVARAICREQCAFYGEPPCFEQGIAPDIAPEWPNSGCDSPGCWALAVAALAKAGVE